MWKPSGGGSRSAGSNPNPGKRSGGPQGGGSSAAKKPKVPNTWIATDAEVDDLARMQASEMAEELRLMSRRVSV